MKINLAETCSEAELQEAIRAAAMMGGWLYYHTHESRRSPAGFPDVVLAHPRRRELVIAELKRTDGRLTLEQRDWLDVLRDCGPPMVELWRPADLDDAIGLLLGR